MMKNYLRLLDKIDGFAAELRRRRPGAFACFPGCADCCVAGIRVWRVEFDHIGDVSRLEARNLARPPTAPMPLRNISFPERETSPIFRCPFLDAESRCSIYEARPAVCRLWGAPLLFRQGAAATEPLVREAGQPLRQTQTPGGLITCCPKNYRDETPFGKLATADTVNMEIVLSALAAINHVYCRKRGSDPTLRLAIADVFAPQ